MITEYILFDVPRQLTREQIVEGMREVSPKWRATPDLIRKTFVYDAEASQAGAFYLWKNKAAAVQAHGDTWRRGILAKYGSVPQIRYFQTPLVVDNVLQAVIEEAPGF
jgi:hypothetical protein